MGYRLRDARKPKPGSAYWVLTNAEGTFYLDERKRILGADGVALSLGSEVLEMGATEEQVSRVLGASPGKFRFKGQPATSPYIRFWILTTKKFRFVSK